MDNEDLPTARYEDLVAEIEKHEASHLVSCERNSVNGFVTFRFHGEGGELLGKLTFDELSDDMSYRAKAVLDYLSTTTNFVVYQDNVEEVWNNADPEVSNVQKAI